MSDDLLSEATRALREMHENPVDGARFTRSRVMASLDQARVRRRTRLAFLIPIAACFVTLSAWGAAGGKLPQALRAAAFALGLEAAEPARRDPPPRPRSAVARPPREPAPAALEPAPAAELAEPGLPIAADSPASNETPVPKPAPIASAPARVKASAPPAADPTHELYRAAHRAHFVEQNPAAALAAWDEYLRAAPHGRFAVEARYNRALSLARLGRSAEARQALAPFAAGKFGGYRQREAAELSAALGGAPQVSETPGR